MGWWLKGTYFENCNCNAVCPCSASGRILPADNDRCQVVLAFHVESGEVDGVDVSNLTVAILADTPQMMYDGNWRVGVFMDAAASRSQAEKLGAVFSGQMGGPMAGVVGLFGETLGTEIVPIHYKDEGRRHSIQIGTAGEIEIEDFVRPQSENGETIKITGIAHPANSTLTIGRATTSRVKAFGLEFSNSGKNGYSAPFSWAGVATSTSGSTSTCNMVKFSAQIREAIDADVYFDEVEQRYARCRHLMVPEGRPADASKVAATPLKVALAFQTGLRNVVELTESFVADVNRGHLGAESAGALLETAGMLIDLQLRLESAAKDKTATVITDLDQQATELLTSTSLDSEPSDRSKALNTLTVIDRTRQKQVKATVCGVGFGLWLIITAFERYGAISGGPALVGWEQPLAVNRVPNLN